MTELHNDISYHFNSASSIGQRYHASVTQTDEVSIGNMVTIKALSDKHNVTSSRTRRFWLVSTGRFTGELVSRVESQTVALASVAC